MPATMPKPTWDTTNQGQLIRSSSTGFRNSTRLWIRPDHKNGRDHAAQQNRPARKHRKHGAIKKPDEQRRDEVDDGGDDQKSQLKGGKLSHRGLLRPGKSRLPEG